MQSTPDLRTMARKVGFDPAYLETFEAKMFIQGPKTAQRLTNFLAILLTGGIVFQLSGLGRLAISDDLVRTRRNAFIVVIAATLLVAVPLTITSYQAVTGALENRAASNVTDEWLADTNYQAVSVAVLDERVTVTIEGEGELRPLRQLAGQLAQTLERPIWVKLRVVPSQIEASNAN